MHLLAPAFALVVLSACDVNLSSSNRREVGRIVHIERPAAKLLAVRAELNVGSLRLVASDDANVHVDLAVWLRTERPVTDCKADIASHLTLTQKDGTLTIADAHAGAADSNDWELRATIKVPPGLDLFGRLNAGQLSAQVSDANDVHVEVASGAVDVNVRNVAGACRAKASSGQIELSIADQGPAGGLDVDVGAGAASVTLPGSVRGSFDLDVNVGGISVDKRYGFAAQQKVTAATARGTVGTGGPTHRLRVGTGQITLQ